jgi:type 1 glutamine amidotransferase/HEAT repeat protein
MRSSLVRECISALVAVVAVVTVGATVPENIKETVKKIQSTNGFEPRELFFTMEIALPKMSGDAEQCKEMAQVLKAAIAAPETTAPAKTIFHQYLLKVDAKAEAKPLGEIFASGACEKKSEEVCLKLLASVEASERLAGLVAYVGGYPNAASKACAEAVKDASWPVRATAIRCLGSLDSKALVNLLPSLSGDDRRIALEVVEEYCIHDSCATVREWAKAGNEQAARALSVIGTATDVQVLAQIPGGDKVIAQMTQKGVDAKITELLKTSARAETRVALLNASALRNSNALPEQLGVAVNDAEQTVRQAAFRLLGRQADASGYPLLVSKLGGPDTEAVENATRLMVKRLGDDPKLLDPLLKRMKEPEAVQDAVLKVLSAFTNDLALAAVVQALPRDAAVRALCDWQTGNAKGALEKIKNDAKSPAHRILAERALIRLESARPLAKPAGAQPELPRSENPEVRANAGAPKKILILTGMEHHNNWKQITPILVEAFAKDKRLEVSVSENPAVMSKTELLAKYDGYVMLYNNSDKKPAPEGALANLKQAVEGGKGFVLVHFSSGAFHDWTSNTGSQVFAEIAGRVWNPKCRGHDRHGTFTVNIADKDHFITKGLSDYAQTDELYTCLDGTVPIHVVASAVSNVDKKVYPLAFVLNPGKGRTFHCALGHCPKAFNEPTLELFKRGVQWSIGMDK